MKEFKIYINNQTLNKYSTSDNLINVWPYRIISNQKYHSIMILEHIDPRRGIMINQEGKIN